jgi:hypothetical protein
MGDRAAGSPRNEQPVIRARPVGRDRCRIGSAALEHGDAADGLRDQMGPGAPIFDA